MTAFDPFWGIQVDYWSWASGIFNEALLPGVLLRLVTEFYNITVESSAVEYLIKAAITVALTLLMLAETRSFGRLCVALCGFVALPFAVFTIWGYVVAVDFDNLSDIRHEVTEYNPETKDITLQGKIDIDWKIYVNTIFWNYDGLIVVSVFGGQVLNPARVYRRAIFFTVLLMMTAYIVSTPAGLAPHIPRPTRVPDGKGMVLLFVVLLFVVLLFVVLPAATLCCILYHAFTLQFTELVGSTNWSMHHKFCVPNGRTILNGSLNWSEQACS